MKAPDLVTIFQALADRTRLRLLHLLSAGEICVCYFVEILGESQPKISRHLGYLRRAGLVSARREGKWVHYSLLRPADESQAEILDATLAALDDDRQARKDRETLERACCALRLPATLEHAPKPDLVRSSAG